MYNNDVLHLCIINIRDSELNVIYYSILHYHVQRWKESKCIIEVQ